MCDCAKDIGYLRRCPCGAIGEYRAWLHDIVQPPCAKCGQKLQRVSEIAKCRCGSTATTVMSRVHGWFVICSTCLVAGPLNSFSQAGAIEAWNALMAPEKPGSGVFATDENPGKPTPIDPKQLVGMIEALDEQSVATIRALDPALVERARAEMRDEKQRTPSPKDNPLVNVGSFADTPPADPGILQKWLAAYYASATGTVPTPEFVEAFRQTYTASRAKPTPQAMFMMKSGHTIIVGDRDEVSVIMPTPYFKFPRDLACGPSPVRRWLVRAAWFIAGAAALAAAWLVATGRVLP